MGSGESIQICVKLNRPERRQFHIGQFGRYDVFRDQLGDNDGPTI
jgi:hypothetical protein